MEELLLRHAGLLMLEADVTHSCSRPAACGDREPVITAGAVARLGSAPTEPAAAAARKSAAAAAATAAAPPYLANSWLR